MTTRKSKPRAGVTKQRVTPKPTTTGAKISKAKKDALVAKVRAHCATFPGSSERPSHGSPTWFIDDKRSYATLTDNHHGDGRFSLWCAAPDGALAMLVDSEPDHYFVPPYVAHLGWVGVHLDRTPWPAVAAVLEQAYRVRAPAKRVAELRTKG